VSDGIYIATAGAVAQSNALDTTANNIANASTVGFHGDRIAFREALGTAKSLDVTLVDGGTSRVDQQQGAMTQTDNPLDLALEGDGYFGVDTAQGPRYTRAGNLQIDDARHLVNNEGATMRGEAGQPITVPPDAKVVGVGADGTVTADGNPVGKLELVRFAPSQLRREGRHAVRRHRPAAARRSAEGSQRRPRGQQRQRRPRRRRSRQGVPHLRVADARDPGLPRCREPRGARPRWTQVRKHRRQTMFRSLATAASGMEAQQTKLDVTANNIANVSTNGFKKGRAEFADLMYQSVRPAGSATSASTVAPSGTEIGLGTRLVATSRDTGQGELHQTGNPLDVAIQGKGYLQVTLPNGTHAYTRNGALQLDNSGKLVTAEGYPVGEITIPPDSTNVTISATGQVTVTQPNQTQATEVGSIQIATFANPEGLAAQGGTLFTETTASGTAVVGAPGEGGAGSLSQGMLEVSNVNVVQEMIDLISGQRAYEVNSRVIKAADEMLGETAQLR